MAALAALQFATAPFLRGEPYDRIEKDSDFDTCGESFGRFQQQLADMEKKMEQMQAIVHNAV